MIVRWLAAILLGLYGLGHLSAGAYAVAIGTLLPALVAWAVLLSGAALLAAAGLVVARSGRARAAALVGLLAAFAVAVYNERLLDLGHPSHHLIRAACTLLFGWLVWHATGADR